MKHILLVIPTLRMGGAEKSLVSLLKALDPARVQVDLYLFEATGVLREQVPAWVNVIEADPVTRGMTLEIRNYLGGVLRAGRPGAALARLWMTAISALRRKLRLSPAFSWDIVKKHIPVLEQHYDAAVGYLEGMTDFFVLDKVHADKKIGWIHTDMSKRVHAPQEAGYYARFDAMATISDICLESFRKCFPAAGEKMQVIENIVIAQDIIDKANAPFSPNWRSDVPHLITVGRLFYHKGIDIGARACKILKDRGVHVCWHVYGAGIMHDEIAAYISENGLDENFILEGMTTNPYPYMRRASILVQPSRLEGKSIVLDEAKILGKAIVVTDYPSVGDQIRDGVTGLITAQTPEAIADGIQALLADPALRRKLEENCRREPNRSIQAVDAFYRLIGVTP